MELDLTTLLVAIGSTLVTVIGVLWGLWTKSIKKNQTELEECEARCRTQTETIISLTGEVNYLRAELNRERQAGE